MRKLNLGSGKRPKQGFINIDVVPFKEADIVRDIQKVCLTATIQLIIFTARTF